MFNINLSALTSLIESVASDVETAVADRFKSLVSSGSLDEVEAGLAKIREDFAVAETAVVAVVEECAAKLKLVSDGLADPAATATSSVVQVASPVADPSAAAPADPAAEVSQ
jgi:hypothetical protein